jgi:hypothetical protein
MIGILWRCSLFAGMAIVGAIFIVPLLFLDWRAAPELYDKITTLRMKDIEDFIGAMSFTGIIVCLGIAATNIVRCLVLRMSR